MIDREMALCYVYKKIFSVLTDGLTGLKPG